MTKRNRVPKQTDFHSVLSEIVRSSVKSGHVQPQERWGSNSSQLGLRGRSASGEVGKQLLTVGTERPIVCEMQLRGLWG